MRFTRILTGLTAAGLLGLTPLALSAPANADGQTYTSNVALAISPAKSLYTYGEEFYVSGSVTGPTAIDTPNGGVASLQISTPSNPTWTTIATDTSPGYLYFTGDFAFSSNSALKVVYSGHTATSAYDDTYLPAESAVVSAVVTRKVVFKNPRSTLIKGKVTPDYNRKPIVVKRKVGKKWKKYKTFKTTGTGKYSFKLPAPRRGKFKWLISIKGDASFAPWATTGSTYSYRPVAARTVAPRTTFE